MKCRERPLIIVRAGTLVFTSPLLYFIPLCYLLPQAAASRAREQVLAQVSAAREALEEEEQRLLEEVQREEERVEQCLLTQKAHWGQALASLSQTRARLVQTLTDTPDAQLAVGEGGVRGWLGITAGRCFICAQITAS